MTRVRRGARHQDTYQICVTIIEARHLGEPSGNPYVSVRLGNRKRKTAVRKRTDNPYYNEYFVFDLTCTLDALLNTRLELAVYLCGRLKRCKLHGCVSFELATVWDQPDHQYHHKWALLSSPRDLAAGPRGYLKCNIAVHAKGEKRRLPPETDGEDDIEGNLLLPLGDSRHFAARQRARYVFTVHRADGLPFANRQQQRQQCHVRVSFAGMKASTSVSCGAGSPNFNEHIVFREMFPPLCHRVRICIRRKGDVVASYLMNLKSISNSGEYGFLPTFGPSFIHLYADAADVTGPIYRGRLLLSLRTEFDRSEATTSTGVQVESAPAIVEDSLWRTEEYLLVGVVYDACMIDRGLLPCGKSVCFELSLGNAGNRKFSKDQAQKEDDEEEETAGARHPRASLDSRSETSPAIVTTLDGKYNCAEIGSRKPCVYVRSSWPDTEWRTRNANRLAFVLQRLEVALERLESLAAMGDVAAYAEYNGMTKAFKRQLVGYLSSLTDMVETQCHGDGLECLTLLDRHRINLCRREVEGVLEKIKANGELGDNRLLGIAMTHAYKHLRTIRRLLDEPQHSLPDVFLWMLSGSRRLAYARLPSSRVAYAEECGERGLDCGQRIDLFLERPRDVAANGDGLKHGACKVEAFLWLGNARYAAACWGAIPTGYAAVERTGRSDVFPEYLEYQKSSKFQLRAHIFQGRFEPGMDSSGLLDPMLRVIFQGYTMTTRVIKQTLDPYWDETLVFPAIDVHGTRERVKLQPPKVVLEAFDRDYGNRLELYGRCSLAPLVKLASEPYGPPDFPARLRWHRFAAGDRGAVLAALELVEVGDNDIVDLPLGATEDASGGRVYRVPEDIRPRMASYRLEVIFWGVRDMRRVNLVPVLRPKIVVECAGVRLESGVLENARKFGNFREIRASVDLEIAEEEIYYPPITIKVYDSRGFGYFKYAGMCNLPTIYVFMRRLVTRSEYEDAIYHSRTTAVATEQKQQQQQHSVIPIDQYHPKNPVALKYDIDEEDDDEDEETALMSYKRLARQRAKHRRRSFAALLKRLLGRWRRNRGYEGEGDDDEALETSRALDKDESHDWWSKYYASLEEEKSKERGLVPSSHPWQKRLATFKVYTAELESQPEFADFQDRLRTFELRRGKRTAGVEDEEGDSGYAGKFKGYIAIYRWPHPDGEQCVNLVGKNASQGLLTEYPSQEVQQLLVRVYVIKAINLRPSDPLSGKADPYLRVKLGRSGFDDRKKYIANQLNPTFGRVFEMEASFPKDHTLLIQVWDYDATTSDDLIGETRVDIENRFYSRHRAHCGLARTFSTSGYNTWRDREKPSLILRQLCRRNNLPLPEYWQDHVKIAGKKFHWSATTEDEVDREEHMALSVLHRWSDFPVCGCTLVPEHIERRPLFNAKRPGLEQGRLEMWIDMFPIDELPAKPAIDISPQAPEEYELRVTVWNTEDVPLVDNQFLTGEKCSDIYVKGWITPEDTQRTDVHYNSLTGEGNFNWRFVFRFTWARGERMMIVKRKSSVFARDYTEQKMPCKLNVQVWDSDHFSKDDFLGALSLDLASMPRGSHNARNCGLKLLEPAAPRLSLFRAQRARAWWPLAAGTEVAGRYVRAGKIEMEMTLLSAAEADERPVGKGRDAPEALPPPDRPDTSFSWFRNPWKACCFVVCRYYRWRILGCCCCLLLVLLVACAVYAFPGYFVKRLLGA